MKKISVIVPIYNVEKYISRCLDSILMQEYENLELILINDGSTDNVEKIINMYLEKYPNIIKYIKKENTGLSDTRNRGIEIATGEYIMFVDSDDYLAPDLLKKLKPYMDKEIEMIKFKAQKVTENGEELGTLNGPVLDETTGEEAFSKMCFEDELMETAWLYLYKTELLKQNSFKFAKGLYHEDFGLIPLIILKAKTFVSTDICGYNYVQSTNSITRTQNYEKTVKKVYDLLIHYDNIINSIEKYDIQLKTKENVKIFCTNSILLRINDLEKRDRKKFIKEIKKRKMTKNIKARNLKQLLKRMILEINIPLYLKIR